MTMTFAFILACFIAYLFGSLSSAIIVCKLMGLPDPRRQGSKNPGATNVLRIGGKKAAVFTLLGDVLKGMVPVLAARSLGFDLNALALIAFAAVIGHLYPIFFGFKGGKGVATTLGVIFALFWQVGCAWLVTWFVILLFTRYASLASIIASVLTPLFIWLLSKDPTVTLVFFGMALVIMARHYQNILNLLSGNERKVGMK